MVLLVLKYCNTKILLILVGSCNRLTELQHSRKSFDLKKRNKEDNVPWLVDAAPQKTMFSDFRSYLNAPFCVSRGRRFAEVGKKES